MKNLLKILFLIMLIPAVSLAAKNRVTGNFISDNTITDNNLANGSVGTGELSDNSVGPDDLRHFNSPTDEYCLTYEATGDQIEYISCSGTNPTLDDVYNNSASGNKSITVDDGAVTLNASGTNKGLIITQSGTGNQAEIGNLTIQADNDVLIPQAVLANKTAPFISNLTIASAGSDNSLKVNCGGTACSSTNPGYAVFNSATSGQLKTYTVTSDVTLDLASAHWDYNGHGNVTGVLLRVLLINDNDSNLRTCVGLLGGRNVVLASDTKSASQSSLVDTPEEILCDTAVGSASNTVNEIGYFRSDFTDSTINSWANQTGIGDFVLGQTADKMWQNIGTTSRFGAGFSSDPTFSTYRWMQDGRQIYINCVTAAAGTSNATTYTQTMVVKAARVTRNMWSEGRNGGVDQTTPGQVKTASGSQVLTLDEDTAGGAWSNTGGKYADFSINFEVGPTASFIE